MKQKSLTGSKLRFRKALELGQIDKSAQLDTTAKSLLR